MTDFLQNYILSFNIFSPLIGVFLILLIAVFASYSCKKNSNEHKDHCKKNTCNAHWSLIIGIFFSAVPLFITTILLSNELNSKYFNFHFEEKLKWLDNLKISYNLVVDGLSASLMLLTEALTIICMIVFWRVRTNYSANPVLAIVLMLILETTCLGVFCATDLILFYIFFEASLIPMLFIIGLWGRDDRVYASLKLFIYTVFGSLLFLFAIIYLKSTFGTSEISELITLIPQLAPSVQKYLWIGMFIAFAIKVPMIPFHTWLPDAHVQAPTFGSMILAGVLIKMGAFAMIKFLIPLFPEITSEYSNFVALLSVFAIIYGALLSLAQTDIKKLIAYSSVSHMGYVTLGIFVPWGLSYNGAAFQMISHGLISAALFMSIGFIYERLHVLEIDKIHSLAGRMKFFSIMFMIFTLGSIGLPGTSGFIGEFLVIAGAASRSNYIIYGILAATGVVFGAIYMLLLYKKIFMEERGDIIGESSGPKISLSTNKLENTLLVIFAFAIIYFGLQPMKINEKLGDAPGINQSMNLKN